MSPTIELASRMRRRELAEWIETNVDEARVVSTDAVPHPSNAISGQPARSRAVKGN